MSEAKSIKRASRIVFSVFLAIALIYFVNFMPLPIFILQPGTADVLSPMVQVKKPAGEDKGKLMLTTVQLSEATVLSYLLSFVLPHQEIRSKKELFHEGESREEFNRRQEIVMTTSQADAILAAYKKLGVPYRIHKELVIQSVIAGMPAHEVLQAGDYIVKLNDQPIGTYEELRKVLGGKKAGDTVSVTYKRNQETRTGDVALAELPVDPASQADSTEPKRVGLGITPVTVSSVQAEAEDQQVMIKAGEIGGPSAGLMFALEIYNRLSPEDITKGYTIAGTGEIDPEGHVGVIGGIKYKIVAADKAGAEIFLAPQDMKLADGRTIPNYTDAVRQAEEIGSKMKIVPVATIDDALKALAALPPKS